MKAVRQIIGYLRERGALSLEQLKHLATHGFLPWEEVFGEEEPDEPATRRTAEVLEDDEHEHHHERPRRRPGTGRREVVHKGPVLEPEKIAARLAERSAEWASPLEGLVEVGRRLDPCPSWREAAVAIRNAEDEALDAALGEVIAARPPGLDRLWTALSFEEYRDVIPEEGAHGPAVNAYRAAMQVADPAQLGKHAWLLKEEEIGHVVNLKRAQTLMLEACGRLLARHPDTFAAALRQDRRSLAYWPFVLVYSARRGTPGHRPRPTVEERWPPREPPDEPGWLRAWAQACLMDAERGPTFLVEHDGREGVRPRVIDLILMRTLGELSLSAGDLAELITRLGFPAAEETAGAEAGAEAEASAPLDDPDAAYRHRLRETLAGLREEIEATETLMIPPDPDSVRLWEGFLLGWLRRQAEADARRFWYYEERLDALSEELDGAFGAVAGLFCPRSWDRKGWS